MVIGIAFLLILTVVTIICVIVLSIQRLIRVQNLAILHKTRQELIIEIQKIREEEKRAVALLSAINARRDEYLRQHEQIQNDVLVVKDEKFKKNARKKEEQNFKETQGEKLTVEVEKETTQLEVKFS
jgi:biopolymer transport protein ExbB/TolQ